MTAEELLLSVRGIEREIQELEEEYQHALDSATRITSAPMSERVRFSPRNFNEEKMVEVSEYAALLKQTLLAKTQQRCKIFCIIDRIPETKLRRLLRLYYLDGLTFEEVAEQLGMSVRYAAGQLKKKAVAEFEKASAQIKER